MRLSLPALHASRSPFPSWVLSRAAPVRCSGFTVLPDTGPIAKRRLSPSSPPTRSRGHFPSRPCHPACPPPLSSFSRRSRAVPSGAGGDRPAAPGSEAGLPAAPSARRQGPWGSFCVSGKPPIWLITRSTPLSAPDSRPQT